MIIKQCSFNAFRDEFKVFNIELGNNYPSHPLSTPDNVNFSFVNSFMARKELAMRIDLSGGVLIFKSMDCYNRKGYEIHVSREFTWEEVDDMAIKCILNSEDVKLIKIEQK